MEFIEEEYVILFDVSQRINLTSIHNRCQNESSTTDAAYHDQENATMHHAPAIAAGPQGMGEIRSKGTGAKP